MHEISSERFSLPLLDGRNGFHEALVQTRRFPQGSFLHGEHGLIRDNLGHLGFRHVRPGNPDLRADVFSGNVSGTTLRVGVAQLQNHVLSTTVHLEDLHFRSLHEELKATTNTT